MLQVVMLRVIMSSFQPLRTTSERNKNIYLCSVVSLSAIYRSSFLLAKAQAIATVGALALAPWAAGQQVCIFILVTAKEPRQVQPLFLSLGFLPV